MKSYRAMWLLILFLLGCGVGASDHLSYQQQIGDAVLRMWILPENLGNHHVEVEVQLLREGHIESITVTKSSGSAELDLSVIDAIRKAEPLSVPSDDVLFESEYRSFKMTFHPVI